MAHDRLSAHVRRQLRPDQRRQLALDVALHAVVRRPRRLGGVHVEAGAQAKVVGAFRVVGHALAAGRGVGCDQHQPEFGGDPLGAGLGGEVLLGAGQARQEPDRWDLAPRGRRRMENGEAHGRSGLFRGMAVDHLPPAEAAAFGHDLEAHAGSVDGGQALGRTAPARQEPILAWAGVAAEDGASSTA